MLACRRTQVHNDYTVKFRGVLGSTQVRSWSTNVEIDPNDKNTYLRDPTIWRLSIGSSGRAVILEGYT